VKLTPAEEAFLDKLSRMSEAERKAYLNDMSRRQEEDLVKHEQARGNLAWRVSKEYDVLVVPKCGGEMWLVDCKFGTNHEFTIDNADIVKVSSVADEMRKRLGIAIKVRFDMWFPRTRQKNNRRYIDIHWDDLGWSIKCTKTPKKIMTQRVKRGSQEERG
jgi:Holliday junction resolvase